MKHLKKILVVLVLVAVIASSVITVVLAEDYSGDVASAESLYEKYENAKATDTESLEDVKAGHLATLYTYLTTNPIDPTSAGYDELVAKYNEAVVKVAYCYLNIGIAEAPTADDAADVMANIFVYLSAAPLYKTEDFEIALTFKCANSEHTEAPVIGYGSAKEFYAGLPAGTTCPDACNAPSIVKNDVVKYSDIYKEIHNTNIDIFDMVVSKLYEKVANTATQANYFEYSAAKEALEKYTADYIDLNVVFPKVDAYTGSLSVVQAKMSALSADASYEELKAGLAEIYDYLVFNPVSPASENYYAFTESYNALCQKLLDMFSAQVASADSIESKITIFNDMYLFLAGTEDVAPKFISAKLVDGYNELRTATIGAYDTMIEDVANAVDFDEAMPTIDYNSSNIATLKQYVNLCKTQINNNKISMAETLLKTAYKTLTNASANKIDPSVSGYKDVIDGYYEVCAVITENYVNSVKNAAKSDKYGKLKEYLKAVQTNPFSIGFIAAYNELRLEVASEYKVFYVGLNAETPVYVPYESIPGDIAISSLNNLLSDITNAYNAYNAAGEEDKPAAFENLKNTVVSIYKFCNNVSISKSETGAESFAEAYSAHCDNFMALLLAEVDKESEPDKKALALSEVKNFLVINPISNGAILAYNAKVAEVFAGDDDKIAAEKLSTIYIEVNAIAAVIEATPNTISTLKTELSTLESALAALVKGEADPADIAAKQKEVDDKSAELTAAYEAFYSAAKAYRTVYEEVLNANKVHDIAYFDFFYDYSHPSDPNNSASAVAGVAGTIRDFVNHEITAAIDGDDVDFAIETVGFYARFLNEINCEAAIKQFNTTISAKSSKFNEYAGFIESGEESVAAFETAFDIAYNNMDAYYQASDLAGKTAAFMAVYENMRALEITLYLEDPAYVPVKKKYDALAADFANALIATLDASSDIRVQYDAALNILSIMNEQHFSEELADAYNAKIAELKSSDIVGTLDSISGGITTVVYNSPANRLNDFSGFGKIVDGGEVDIKQLVLYFNKLSGKESGILALDFAAHGFVEVVAEYDNALKTYLANINTSYEALASDPEKIQKTAELLSVIKNDFAEITATSDMVTAYNSMRSDLIKAQKEVISSTFKKYKVILDEVHTYMDNCPIDTKAIDDEAKKIYSDIKIKLETAEYAEALSYINDFNNVSGNTATLKKQQAYTKLARYDGVYGLESGYTEKKLVDYLLLEMFGVLVDEFDATLVGLEDNDRTNAINNFAYFIEYMQFPQAFVNAFKAEYPTATIQVTAPAATVKVGKIGTLSTFINAFYEAEGFDAMQVEMARAITYINVNPISSEDLKTIVADALETMDEELSTAIIEQKEALQKDTNFNDYSLGYTMQYDMENGKVYTNSFSNNGDKGSSATVKTDATTGNKYAEVTIGSASSYYNVTGFNSESTFVTEFDLMSPDGNCNFYINFTEWGIKNTTLRVTSNAVRFVNGQLAYQHDYYSGDGANYEFPNYREGIDDPIEMIPGQWMHIIFIVDPVNFEIELIIDYTSLGKKPLVVASGTTMDTCKFTEMRWQSSAANSMYCYDNFVIYNGDAYRDPHRFDNKTTDELFEFYVDYARDETNQTVNRMNAYYSAAGLLDDATNQEYKNIFAQMSVDEILESAQLYYRESLEELSEPLKSMEITTANISEAEAAIKSVRNYITANQTYMDQSADWFVAVNDIILDAEAKVKWAQNLSEYAKCLPLFQRAPSLTALKKHFDVADKYYKLCSLNNPDYLAKANEDEVIKAVIETLCEYEDAAAVLEDDISVYHKSYMPERIKKQTYVENSKKLVECVDAIELLAQGSTGLTPEQYYDLVVTKAEENVDYVNAYMVAMRDIIVAGTYNEDYPEMEETLIIYNMLDEVFYTIVQEEHYKLIEEQIERYKKTNSYIERAGICTYIENYIVANNVDILSHRGSLLNYTVSVYKAELVVYKTEYEAILEANTKAFIAITESLKAYTEYADIKPLYQDAVDNYYYNMNVDSDAAKAAIETFAVYEEMVQNWELNSKFFIDYSANLQTLRRPAQIYRALVNCTKYIDGISADVEGVAAALELYNTKLAEYNATIESTNGEVSAAVNVVCSVRTSVIPATVLAIIKKMFII